MVAQVVRIITGAAVYISGEVDRPGSIFEMIYMMDINPYEPNIFKILYLELCLNLP